MKSARATPGSSPMRRRAAENNAPHAPSVRPNQAEPTNIFCFHFPQGPLGAFVERFWYWKGHTAAHSLERVLPTGTVQLVLDLGCARTSSSLFSGPRSTSSIIHRTAQDELLGIHFKPGGAFPFLPLPLRELRNLQIGIEDLWGTAQAETLLSLLHQAETPEARFSILETWLVVAMRRPLHHHPAVAFAMAELQRSPNLSTRGIAQKVNLSQRCFIEIFADQVGLTPKLFSRVQRFNQVVGSIAHQSDVDWLELALASGYCDQAHLIHEFQEFSSATPTEYLGLRTEHLSHLRVAGDR